MREAGVLCDDAIRLGRVLAELLPDELEVHGLVSLMEPARAKGPFPSRP
jgi:predicted RNA polymerase sigma factor